jgi:hypothetical protein
MASRVRFVFALTCPDPTPIRHIAVGLDPRRSVGAGASMAHQAVRPNLPRLSLKPCLSRETHTTGTCACTRNAPTAPPAVGRVRDRIGSLGYSLKRARLQTGLRLLEYSYSLFCSGGMQGHIVMGPPHRKNCCLPRKSKGPEAGFRSCINLHFNLTVSTKPFLVMKTLWSPC